MSLSDPVHLFMFESKFGLMFVSYCNKHFGVPTSLCIGNAKIYSWNRWVLFLAEILNILCILPPGFFYNRYYNKSLDR